VFPPLDESDHVSHEPQETHVFLSPLNVPTQLRGFLPSAPLPSSTRRVFHVMKAQRETITISQVPQSKTGVPSTGADFRHLFACSASAQKKIFVEIFFPSVTMCVFHVRITDSHGNLHHFFFESESFATS
jgi:hypothetical protein